MITGILNVLLGRGAALLATFAWGVWLARLLGPGLQGVLSIVVAETTLLALLFSAGAGESAVYHLGKKRYSREKITGFIIAAAALSGLLGIITGILIAVSDPAFLSGIPTWSIIAGAAVIPLLLFNEHTMLLLVAAGKSGSYTALNCVRGGLMLLSAVPLLVFPALGLAGGLFSWICGAVGASVLASIYILKWAGRPAFPSAGQVKDSLSYGLVGASSRITGFLNLRLDIFLVNYFLGLRATGIYTVSVLLAETLQHIPVASGMNLFPKIASGSGRALTLRVLSVNLVLLFGLALIIAASASILVPFVFGEEYRDAVLPLLWLLPGMPGLAAARILANHFLGKGKPSFNLAVSVLILAINLILNIELIPLMGESGAALASTIAYSAGSAIMILLFIRERK